MIQYVFFYKESLNHSCEDVDWHECLDDPEDKNKDIS